MDYNEIMRTITSGLTGDSEHDLKYLSEQAELYKTHELAQEILRGIGRLISDALPQEKRDEISQVINNYNSSEDAVIEEAEFQISKKNFNKALELLESQLKEFESDDGEFNQFPDDSVSEYYSFRNLFENILYCELNKPQKKVRYMRRDFDRFYLVYGSLLFELKRFDESKKALETANRINPMNTKVLFELSEISKVRREWDRYLELSKYCLKIAYSRKDLSRCYRNIGFYYIEKQSYDLAIALYYLSLHYDDEPKMAQSELFYIQQVTGKPTPAPSIEEIKSMFAKNDIQLGPSDDVINLAVELGIHTEKDKQYGLARFFFSIAYELTNSDAVKKRIDSLPATNDAS